MACVPAVDGYFTAMQAVCAKHGALLILDEVLCGMGRSGSLHAWEQENVVPDIQAIGKALGGGYIPIAAVLLSHKVASGLEEGSGAFNHRQSFQGHPAACAAALEVQKIIREEELVANVQKMGLLLSSLFREKIGNHPHVGDIRGKGLFWGIELVKDKKQKTPFDLHSKIASRIHRMALQPPYNISILPGSGPAGDGYGDYIILAPAYNVTEDEVKLIVDRTSAVIQDFFTSAIDLNWGVMDKLSKI